MPTVSSEEEARELVEHQDSNPDLNVARIMERAAEDGRIRAGAR
jgi:hypothetical protein